MLPNNYLSTYRVPPLAMLVLLIALVQGTSTSLTIVYHFARPLEAMVNIVWMGTYALAGAGLFASFGVNWITWLMRYRFLLVVLLVGVVVSAFWSLDSILTIERSVHLVGSTFIAFFIGFTVPLSRIISISAAVFTVLMILSAALAIGFPEFGTEEYAGIMAWKGIMAAKNTLGFWASIACMLCVAMFSRYYRQTAKALVWLLAFAVALLCLIKSESATSLLALGVAGVITTGLTVAHRFRLGLIATLVLASLAIGVIVVLFQQINTAELIGRSGDLTGRGEVWSQTWKIILDRPLTGYGYGTLWYPTEASARIQQSLLDFTWVVYHAHNGFLQVASEIGLPMAFIALLMVLQQMVELIYCQYQRQQIGTRFVIAFSAALLLSNYSEARFLVNREMYWIFFIMMPISMLQQVSVVMRDGQLNPLPLPLNDKIRAKAQDRVATRSRRREMKSRLKNARQINPTEPGAEDTGHILDGQLTQKRSNP